MKVTPEMQRAWVGYGPLRGMRDHREVLLVRSAFMRGFLAGQSRGAETQGDPGADAVPEGNAP